MVKMANIMGRLIFIVFFLSFYTYSINTLSKEINSTPTMPDVRKSLLNMAKKDQDIRIRLGNVKNLSEKQRHAIKEIDDGHTEKLKQIISKYGWPTISMIGYDGVDAFWLLLQHSPDASFQRNMLPHVEAAFNNGELNSQNYALFVDRVLVRDGKAQKYGTQIKEVINNTPILYPIENQSNVNELRASIGLFNLEDYLQMAKAAISPEKEIKVGFGKVEQKNKEAGIGIELDIIGSGSMDELTVKSFTVMKVLKNSSADKAGIMAGDQLIEIDNMRVEGSNINTLLSAMDKPAGDNVNIIIKRVDGNQDKLTLEITESKQK
jgi:hypothetical protein